MNYKEALKLLNDMQFKDEYQGKDEYTDMLLACKQALEKQIPHKLKPNNSQIKGGCIPVCGKCNGIMDLEQGDLNYCPNCGQAIDWSDEI